MSRARDLGSLINSTAAGKNLVANGGFDCWQRGTTFNNAGNETYHADRWFLVNDGISTVNISRINIADQGLGVTYASRVERSAGNNRTVYINITEGALDLVGKQVTLSFYMRKGSGLTDNISIAFGTRSAKYGVEANSAGFSIANSSLNTSTFTRFTKTLNITTATSTANANLFELEFSFWQTGTPGAYFEIAAVQLEVGNTATSFSKSGGDLAGELQKCQKYYYRWNKSAYGDSHYGNGFGISSTAAYIQFQLPVPMRIEISNTAQIDSSGFQIANGGSAFGSGSWTVVRPNNLSPVLQYGGTSGLTVSGYYMGYANTNAYIGFSAEF